MVSSSQQSSATPNSSVQQQLISFLQTLVIQQQQRKQQQEYQQPHTTLQPAHDLSSAITKKAKEILQMQSSLPIPMSTIAVASSTSSITTTSSVTASNTAANIHPVTNTVSNSPDIPDSDIEAAMLNNFLSDQATGSRVSGSHLTSRLFHTSSDTVDQLLRGLSTKTHSTDSIRKLSQDTACVLPTFARALQSSMGLPSSTNNSTAGMCIDASVNGETSDAGVTNEMIRVVDRERTPAEMSGTVHTCTVYVIVYCWHVCINVHI